MCKRTVDEHPASSSESSEDIDIEALRSVAVDIQAQSSQQQPLKASSHNVDPPTMTVPLTSSKCSLCTIVCRGRQMTIRRLE